MSESVGMDSDVFGVTVACVCVPGPGNYTFDHVCRLFRMVKDHLKQSFVLCPITISPLPGWWAKVDLFQPGRFRGRVLYLDLDVTVTGDLMDLVNIDAPFAIIRDWHTGNFNSSVMVWDAGAADHIFTNFNDSVMKRYRGDQGWIHECMPYAATFPKRWCLSYKKHIRPRLNDSLPEDCRVICFHGAPKAWDLPEGHKDARYV